MAVFSSEMEAPTMVKWAKMLWRSKKEQEEGGGERERERERERVWK